MTSSLRKTKLIFRQLEQQTVLLLSLWIALNWIRTQQLNALCTLCVQIYNTSVYVLLWKKSAWKRDDGMNKIKWGNKTWTNFAAEPIYKMDFEERFKSAHVARRYKAKVKSSIKRDELSICSLLSERNDVEWNQHLLGSTEMNLKAAAMKLSRDSKCGCFAVNGLKRVDSQKPLLWFQ